MKYTEIPEHWNLSIMYKVNGLSRSIYVRYKTKELAEQEMRKQWKEFCKRYDVAEKDLVMKYGTCCEYSKGGVIYMADLLHIDGAHVETIEFNLKSLKVSQSRGLQNKQTEYHEEILALMKANAKNIKKLTRRKAA